MNDDILQGKWTRLKGAVQHQWGKLTNDDLDMIQEDSHKLIGMLLRLGTGFTALTHVTQVSATLGVGIYPEYKVVSVTGTQTADGTFGTSSNIYRRGGNL